MLANCHGHFFKTHYLFSVFTQTSLYGSYFTIALPTQCLSYYLKGLDPTQTHLPSCFNIYTLQMAIMKNPTILQVLITLTMNALPLLSLLLLLPLTLSTTSAQLRVDHYRNTCPNVESIVHAAVKQKFEQTFTTAPGTLRLFFHDCFIRVIPSFTLLVLQLCDRIEDNMQMKLSVEVFWMCVYIGM